MEKLIFYRNYINHWLYRNFIKRIVFLFDPEDMHKLFLNFGVALGSNPVTKKIINMLYYYENPILEQELMGIKFSNPVGLSAGFDKNAQIISISRDVGFGFSEVGSVTKDFCSGNPGKRLERVIANKSLWVNLGLNNSGVDKISMKLKNKKYGIPFGISIAKTNCKETADDNTGKMDYVYTLNKLNSQNLGLFYVLNISCPNAFGGQPFSRPSAYESLLKEIDKLNIKKPILVKLSPDITKKNLDLILKISSKHKIKGFICSNLTKKHNYGSGGLSGKIVEKASNEQLKYIYSKTKGKYLLIAVGGIFSAEDAYKKIKLGANLVELITGMIYEGPNLISDINLHLAQMLKNDGYSNISEAVGMMNNSKN